MSELKILGFLLNSETWPKEGGGEPSQADMNLCTQMTIVQWSLLHSRTSIRFGAQQKTSQRR